MNQAELLSDAIMAWRRAWGPPGVPFPLEHRQHWDLVERIQKLIPMPATLEAREAPDFAKELIGWLDNNVMRCGHGYIGTTCHICMRDHLPR